MHNFRFFMISGHLRASSGSFSAISAGVKRRPLCFSCCAVSFFFFMTFWSCCIHFWMGSRRHMRSVFTPQLVMTCKHCFYIACGVLHMISFAGWFFGDATVVMNRWCIFCNFASYVCVCVVGVWISWGPFSWLLFSDSQFDLAPLFWDLELLASSELADTWQLTRQNKVGVR